MAGDEREIYFEHQVVGRQVKVTAICSVTGVESAILGPPGAGQAALEALALARLEQRLGLKRSRPAGPGPAGGEGAPPAGGGRLV